MKLQRALLALAAIALFAATLVPWSPGSIVAASTPSPVPTYCAPIYTPVPGASGLAGPMATELSHAEVCGGQYGDVYSDGPFYTPAPTSTANSFSFTLPANVFSIFGRRTYVPDTGKTAVNNSTTYCYLDSSGYPNGIWNCTTSNRAPNPYAELMYTITTNGSGITAITTPAPAHLFVQNVHIQSQAGNGGDCALFNADGSLQASPCPSGGGGGGNAVLPGNCISVSPTASPTGGVVVAVSPGCTPYPTPTGSSANANCSFAGLVLTCTTPTPFPAPTSANPNCSFSGSVLTCTTPTPYNGPTPYPTPTIYVTSAPCTTNSGIPSGSGLTITVPICITPNPFEAAVLARSDVTHFWEMHDNPGGCASNCTPGPCPTGMGGIADSVGSGATAVPSPVPLTAVTTSPLPAPECGMPAIYFGGGPSIGFCLATNATTTGCGVAVASNSYLQIPASISPAEPFTVFCVINNASMIGSTNGIWTRDSSTNFEFGINTSGQLITVITNVNKAAVNFNSTRAFIVQEVGSTTSPLFQNGTPVAAPSSTPAAAGASAGAFGSGYTTALGNLGWSGTLEDCGYANTAWSLGTVQYLYSLLGNM